MTELTARVDELEERLRVLSAQFHALCAQLGEEPPDVAPAAVPSPPMSGVADIPD